MYAGRIVERGSTEEIFNSPQHPYTWGLLKSIPRLDSPRGEELVPISGRPPSLINRPSGCHFHPRCPYVREAHKRVDPKLAPVDGSAEHVVACLLESSVRSRIWDGLQTGRDAESLRGWPRRQPEPDGAPPSHSVSPESEGTRPRAVRGGRRRVRAPRACSTGRRSPTPDEVDHRWSATSARRRRHAPDRRTPRADDQPRRGPRPRQALPDQARRHLPAADRRGEGRRRHLLRRQARARRSGSSARRDAARAPPPACCAA